MRVLELDFVPREARSAIERSRLEEKGGRGGSRSSLANHFRYAVGLMLREKEILLFSALQWLAIALVYYIWVQVLGWIPNEVWESESKLNDIPLNLVFLAWSFACVAMAAYPISLLTAAMGAAYFLRQKAYPSTIAACLKLALPNSGRLWAFHTMDAWLTVDIILERLPKRGYFSDVSRRVRKEALYYAWKVGTIGMPASLLMGKGLIEAGKESIDLVKRRAQDVIKLRGSYSLVCWMVGISAYVGSIVFYIRADVLFEGVNRVFTFYFWMGVPILTAVAAIKLFVRPIFVIASCRLYADYLLDTGGDLEFRNLPSKGTSVFVSFLTLCLFVLVVALYREELGLMNILRVGTG